MGGKNQTTTSTNSQSYTPAGLSGLQDVWSRLQQAASTPYQPYAGQLTAGLTPTQQSGISNVNAAYGTAQPYIDTASNYATQGAAPISSGQISNYLNPYNQDVINATQAQFSNQNAQQQAALKGNAVAQGALGGNRVGVAQAQLAGQQQLAQAPVIAGLNAQNYNQALGAAQADRAAQGQAAYTFGNLGTTAQNAALQGAQAQLGAGTLEQQTQQNALNAQYQQYLQQLAFPYQQAQFLASYGLPTLSGMGGTQSGNATQTTPGPSPWGQIAGTALTAASLFAKDGGRIKGYADGGVAGGSPFNFIDVGGYIPKAAAIPVMQQHQMSPMGISGQPNTNNGLLSGMPSASTIQGASGGLKNLFSGFNSSQLSAPELLGSGEYVGPLGYHPQGEKRGGRITYADGGDVAPGDIGSPLNGSGLPRVFASPQDQQMLNADLPLTADRASQIYDAYQRVGGGQDVSNSQFVKNSQFGIAPWASLTRDISNIPDDFVGAITSIKKLLRHRYEAGGVVDMTADPSGVYSMAPSRVAGAFDAMSPYTGINVPATIPQSAGFNAPALPPPTSIAAMPVANAPSAVDMGARGAPAYGDRYARAIGGIESGNDYTAVGPETAKGDRAYGKYQVMGSNIPEWTAAVIGKPMTPQEFLANPQAQDAVFKAQFGSYVDKYGPEGAAKAWFAGERGMNDPNRKDILGTTVADYAGKFNRALGFADNAQPDNPLSNLATDMSAKSAAPNGIAASPGGQFLSGLFSGKGGGLSDAARQGLLAAGLGMMASRSPFALSAIGEGGLQGVGAYTNARKMEQERDLSQQRVDLQARQLQQQAENFAKEYGLKQQTLQETQRSHDLALRAPVKIGVSPGGLDIMALPRYNPDTKQIDYYRINRDGTVSSSPIGSATGNNTDALEAARTAGPPVEARAGMPMGSPAARNQSFMDALRKEDPQYAADIKAVADYQMSPQVFSIRNGARGRSMGDVFAYDPTYNQQLYGTIGQALKSFNTGKQGDLVRSFNVALDHLGTVEELGRALQNGDTQVLNSIKNTIKTQFGYGGPPSFEAAKQIVADEIAKAVIGGQNAQADREGLQSQLKQASSPEQLLGVVSTFKRLMAGQLNGLKHQYETSTRMHNFDEKLTPLARSELEKIQGGGTENAPASPTAPSASPTISSKADYDKLPSGAEFVGSDGKKYRKP